MAHFFHHHHASHTTSVPIFASLATPHHRSHARPYPHPHPVPTSSVTSTRHHTRAAPRAHSTAVVDPVLAYHPNAAHASIEFDLTLPPSQILVSHGPSRSSYAGLSPRDLTQPATSPPLPYIRIKCEHLPWSIDVYPAAHSGSGVVTVGDVLQSVYRALRHRVSGAEWNASSVEMQHRVRDAWVRRCKRQQSHKERTYEHSNGLRRIDWLGKTNVFQGLSPGKSLDHWVMHVNHGEKYVKFRAGS